MRSLLVLAGSALIALALGPGTAAAGAAHPFHGGETCQPISATKTVCAEIWGVSKLDEDGDHFTVAHRRFTEFTSGVMTFEQRDLIRDVVHLDASGAEQVNISYFSGWSSPTGLICTWREHLVVIQGEAVFSVDQFACESA